MTRSGHSNLTAEIYEISHPTEAEYKDVDYFLDALGEEPGRVLELACGTGRFLAPLLAAGISMEGLDHSPEMLALCARNCARRGVVAPLHLADMASFELPRRYDAILVGAGAIKELPGRELVLQSLRSCRRALVPGGSLLIDLLPQRHVSLAISVDRPTDPLPMQYWERDSTMWAVETVLLEYDASLDRTVALRRYEKWQDGKLQASELHRFYMQHWTLDAFTELLNVAGFTEIEAVANYERNRRPGANDTDWTFHAIAQRNEPGSPG